MGFIRESCSWGSLKDRDLGGGAAWIWESSAYVYYSWDWVRREIGKNGKDGKVDDHHGDVRALTGKEQTVEKET